MPISPTPPFPLYLLPSIPFRRRRSSATTASSTSSPSSSPPQPTSFLSSRPTTHLRCHKCLMDLVPTSSIISKGFTGRYGRAYLVGPPTSPSFLNSILHDSGWSKGDLPNVLIGKPQPRQLVTGAHTVSDITCKNCRIVLGWKYVEAAEETQRYKVGKYILETKRVIKSVGWEDGAEEDFDDGVGKEGDDIEFDSQDEDECEDLFSGMWSPALASKRRKNKSFRAE